MLTSSPQHIVIGIYNVHVVCYGRILFERNTTFYKMTKVVTYWFSEAPGHVQNWAALEALISFLHEHILKNGFNYVGFEQPNSSVFQIW